MCWFSIVNQTTRQVEMLPYILTIQIYLNKRNKTTHTHIPKICISSLYGLVCSIFSKSHF